MQTFQSLADPDLFLYLKLIYSLAPCSPVCNQPTRQPKTSAVICIFAQNSEQQDLDFGSD